MEAQTESGRVGIVLFRYGRIPVEACVPCACTGCTCPAGYFVKYEIPDVSANLCEAHLGQLQREEDALFERFETAFWQEVKAPAFDTDFARCIADLKKVNERAPAIKFIPNKSK